MAVLRLMFFILMPIVFVVVPTPYFESGHSLCLVKNLFGIECPGCGLTRALSSLVHGDFVAAIRFNRSVILIGPLVCYTLVRTLLDEFGSVCSRFIPLVRCRNL